MRKKVILFVIVISLGILGYNYLYQDHRDISKENPDIEVTSEEFSKQFFSNSELSEQKYLDKTLQIMGTITELNDLDITLDDGVFCQFKSKIDSNLKVGDKLTIKGRCIGYDDLLEQVKMNECIVIE